MAKNTSSSAFRKLDVDQCNEDIYREEEQGELQSPPVGPDESEVTSLLNQYPYIPKFARFWFYILIYSGS